MYCCYQDLLIRDWHPRDRQATADLISQVLAEYGLYWEPETADRDILTVEASYWAQGGEFWVVEQAGTLVGTAAYYPVAPEQFGVAQIPDQAQPLDGPAVEMRKLYLLPVVRGRGLGTWLVQQLERSIADRGYSMIWIETATVLREATKLYEKQGYCHQDMSQLVVERCDLLMAKAIQSEPIQERPLGKVAAFATTRAGVEVLSRICGDFRIPLWSAAPVWAELAQFTSAPDRGDRFSSPPAIAPGTPGNLTASVLPPHLCHSYESSLRETLTRIWQDYDGFIFSLATGAIIRLISPLLQDKSIDPAVIAVDEAGQFTIGLCSGHQGGADPMAQTVAQLLGATAVLTGSSAVQGLGAIDLLGEPFGWRRGRGDWTGVSAAAARGLPIAVFQEVGSSLWQSAWSHLSPQTEGEKNQKNTLDSGDFAAKIWITAHLDPDRDHSSLSAPGRSTHHSSAAPVPQVTWHPRVLWLGIGCERGTPAAVIAEAIDQTLRTHHLAAAAIAGVATLDLKGDEPGLLQVCADRQLPLRCFTPEQLDPIPVPTPSPVVAREVGTASVAEAAARLAAGYTAAQPSQAPLLVPKQIHRQPSQPGAVTLAIAQADRELTGRSGSLALIGTGPGAMSQITPAAQAALTAAEVVIGYGLYVDLVRPLLRSGQIIEALPITQERARAERAIELAQWGLRVAVISSGDSGIYGMAGLVLESLSRQGWDGQTPGVQVFPGITALQAAAAQVGTPLMHDFCAISLSDLLTPWPVIEKRLQAAAEADFVVALYNPRSKTRQEPFAQAQRIFLQHRKPSTPVALVRSAYRPDQTLLLTTLGELRAQEVDMLTTVLIGNASTYRHGNWLITPRGYLGQV